VARIHEECRTKALTSLTNNLLCRPEWCEGVAQILKTFSGKVKLKKKMFYRNLLRLIMPKRTKKKKAKR